MRSAVSVVKIVIGDDGRPSADGSGDGCRCTMGCRLCQNDFPPYEKYF